jgi:NAD(P)H dehydrogenase (quinone)
MSQNTGAKFLVVGAGGRTGATGNHVVRQLLARKLPVRALVFRADQRSEQLAALGAEVVVGDLHDLSAVRRAMRDVTRAYFVYPLAEGLLEAATLFCAAAKEAGVESIVFMSQLTARDDFPSLAARRYWLAERIFGWTGIGVTHLQPTLFFENLLVFADTIRDQSKIFLSYGAGKSAPVSSEDVARVIVNVLIDPAPHRGRTYVLTGPRSLTMSETAAAFGRVLGKPVEYVDLPLAALSQALAQLQMSPYLIEYLSRVAEAHQRGDLDVQNDLVRQLGGAPPKSVEAFVAEHRAAFGG